MVAFMSCVGKCGAGGRGCLLKHRQHTIIGLDWVLQARLRHLSSSQTRSFNNVEQKKEVCSTLPHWEERQRDPVNRQSVLSVLK